MNSLFRWFRRRRELALIDSRRHELETELSAFCAAPVSLTPAAMKGGYDEIFYAQHASGRFGVVRLFSPYKEQKDPIGPYDPAVPLEGRARLEREWEAYRRLSPAGLSPKPLWRTEDAIVCSWLPWERASMLLARHAEEFWPLFERALSAIQAMHDVGVVHLDLNWGNLLAPLTGDGLAIIDFEFGPVPWVSAGQQLAYDYLRLVDDSTKPRRGGSWLLADLDRLERVLEACVPPQAREAKMGFVFHKLVRLGVQTELRVRLQRIFPNLEQ